MRTYALGLIAIAALYGCERAPDPAPPVEVADARSPTPSLPDPQADVQQRDSVIDVPPPPRPDPADRWEQADIAVPRLSPDSFPQLPDAVRDELKRRGCVVPQTYMHSARHNVVSGAFTAEGAVEWAVLCSVERTSEILMLDAVTGAVVDSLRKDVDVHWLQTIGDGQIGFSRLLGVLTMSEMKAMTMCEGDAPLAQPIDHDAIEQFFTEKGGSAFYRTGSDWRQFGTQCH